MTTTIGYRPALLRGRVEHFLDGDTLSLSGGKGATINLGQLRTLRYASIAVTGTISQYLVLSDQNGHHRLSQSLTIAEKNGARDQEFRDCVAMILERIEQAAPGRAVLIGPAGRMRWTMFAVGALTLLAALGLGGAIIATGALSRRGPEGLIYVAAMLALGGYVSWRYRPGQTEVSVSAAQLAEALRVGAA